MLSLNIDATHQVSRILETYTSSPAFVPTLFVIGIVVITIIALAVLILSSTIERFNVPVLDSTLSVVSGIISIIGLIFTMVGFAALADGFDRYQSSPHIAPSRATISTVKFDVKTDKSGNVESSTKAGDKPGTTWISVTDEDGHAELMKISKNQVDVSYNSGSTPKLVARKVTDSVSGKSYYEAKSVSLNNQPIQFK